MSGAPLCTQAETIGATVHVTVTGMLDAATAGLLRDDLLKHTADGPDALAVHVDALAWEADRLLTIFSVVARRAADWPGSALVLVCRDPELRHALDGIAISRFVPVVADASDVAAVVRAPDRQRAWRTLSRERRGIQDVLAFVREVCERWNAEQFIHVAASVAGELVENARQHASAQPRVRLELRRGMFTVAVTDDSPGKPVLLESAWSRDQGLGLHIVAGLAKTWGATSTPSGGKVVWAVLTEANVPGDR